MERIIRKIWLNKSTKQKMLTIPISSNLKEGDYVEVIGLKNGK